MSRPVGKKGDLLLNVALEFPVYKSAEMDNSLLLTEINFFFSVDLTKLMSLCVSIREVVL